MYYKTVKMQTYKIVNRHYALLKMFGITGGFFAYGQSVQEAINGAFANYYYWELNR